MTKIVFSKNKQGDFYGFVAKGHAGGGEAGFDIYCAAISAITQTAVIGLEDVCKVKVDIKMKDGFLSAFIDENDAKKENCQVVFKTLNLGLQSFKSENPKYIQIFEEVQ